VLEPQQSEDIDLEAALTHELGHFLGLDHSDVPGATMQPEAMGFGATDLRTLEADDIAGICAIYGEGNLPEPEPETELERSASQGGCAIVPSAGRNSQAPWASLLFGLLLFAKTSHRRRSQAR
jgi:hypothetical protein